ncbi:WXG100 family type VII secretion target [Tersicoccus sp. MR15.9]|uniref:WXG100 family type VII secretion target n=1 Tax=Tersicoccus mangrovi TaxID=3121635 RepID=UPI002FE50415
MAVFTVDSAALQANSAAVRGTVERIRAEVATMHAGLQALEGSWTGQASALFQGVVAQWRTTEATVESSLESITAALDAAAAGYEEAEARNAALFHAG